MKKTLVLLVFTLCLCIGAPMALAGGLAGLGSGYTAPASGLPDPAEALDDQYGKILQENYQFSSDYLCTAYLYPHPDSVADFIDDYAAIAKKRGYTVTETTIEGMEAYTVQSGDGKYAILVPYFDNQLLFLVQNGMRFSPSERQNYLTMTFNGDDCELRVFKAELSNSCYDMMMEYTERDPFRFFNIYIPANAKAGSEYYIHDEVYIDELNLLYDNREWLVQDFPGYVGRGDAIETGRDFFRLTITEKRIIEEGTLLKGTFSARFKGGDIVIEDGEFCVIFEKYL